MSSTHADEAFWRVSALRALALGLSTSVPVVAQNRSVRAADGPLGPTSVAIVVEERPEFLADALAYVGYQRSMLGEVPVVAVGVTRLPREPLSIYVCGGGSDAELMHHIARCIGEGRLSNRVLLLVESFRARWWNGVFAERARDRQLRCAFQAGSVYGELPDQALLDCQQAIIAQARQVVDNLGVPGIDPDGDFAPDGDYYKALEYLTAP